MVAGGHKGVVLVVDDEPAIRLLCKVNLELDGYEVREAGTLDEARKHLEGPVDVVLLDMHIGRERGEVLLEELIARQIPVAVVTGSKISPGLFESIELLGRDETLGRLSAAASAAV